MFIQQVFKFKYDFWRYLIGVLIIIIAVIVGQVPLGVAVLLEGGYEMVNMTQTQMFQLLGSNLSLFLILLSFAAGLGAIFFVVKVLHKQPIKELTTSRKKMDWGRFFFAFGLVAIFAIATTLVDYYTNPQDYVINFQPKPFFMMLVIAVIMIPLQTGFEEYLFRGYLMQGIGTLLKTDGLH